MVSKLLISLSSATLSPASLQLLSASPSKTQSLAAPFHKPKNTIQQPQTLHSAFVVPKILQRIWLIWNQINENNFPEVLGVKERGRERIKYNIGIALPSSQKTQY